MGDTYTYVDPASITPLSMATLEAAIAEVDSLRPTINRALTPAEISALARLLAKGTLAIEHLGTAIRVLADAERQGYVIATPPLAAAKGESDD